MVTSPSLEVDEEIIDTTNKNVKSNYSKKSVTFNDDIPQTNKPPSTKAKQDQKPPSNPIKLKRKKPQMKEVIPAKEVLTKDVLLDEESKQIPLPKARKATDLPSKDLKAQFLKTRPEGEVRDGLEQQLNFMLDRLLLKCARSDVAFDQIAEQFISGRKVTQNAVQKFLGTHLRVRDDEAKEAFMEFFEFLLTQVNDDSGEQIIISEFDFKPISPAWAN